MIQEGVTFSTLKNIMKTKNLSLKTNLNLDSTLELSSTVRQENMVNVLHRYNKAKCFSMQVSKNHNESNKTDRVTNIKIVGTIYSNVHKI